MENLQEYINWANATFTNSELFYYITGTILFYIICIFRFINNKKTYKKIRWLFLMVVGVVFGWGFVLLVLFIVLIFAPIAYFTSGDNILKSIIKAIPTILLSR